MTSNNLHTWPLSVSFVTDIVVIFYNNSLVNCENCANSVSVCTLTYIGIPTPTLHSRIVLQTKKKKTKKLNEGMQCERYWRWVSTAQEQVHAFSLYKEVYVISFFILHALVVRAWWWRRPSTDADAWLIKL